MARIAILGAGIGGIPMAFEMKELSRKEDEIIVISDSPTFHFVPSNPWVAVNWRKPSDLKVELAPVFKKKKITFVQKKAARVMPQENRVELADGSSVEYGYLVIATGPKLAFDEVPGLGPKATPIRSAMWTTPGLPASSGRASSKTPALSSSARCKARRASARPMNTCSSPRRICAAAKSATR